MKRPIGWAKYLGIAIFLMGMLALSTPARADVTVNPSVVNFGTQAVNSRSAAVSIKLTNTGSRRARFTSAAILGRGFSYWGPTGWFTIQPGQSMAVSVSFSPALAQQYSGTLTFTRSTGALLRVSLSGAGVSASPTTTTTAPSITGQPVSRTVTAGQTASFSATVSGTSPFTYQWMKNGGSISGATSASFTTPVTATSDNGEQFTVVVGNSAGSATSNPAMLTVTVATVAPSITGQPVSRTVTAGQTASFSVIASGTSPFTYQWMKNGASISGATSASYTTPVTATSDNGEQFTVMVSNSAGNVVSSAATLTVNAAVVAPSITTQPVNRTVTAGQTASFSVIASGTSPFTYQWMKGGASISGATSASYTTPVTAIADNAAQFTVMVSNSAGNVTSNAATLTVNAAVVTPSITTQPVNRTVTAGQTASFSVIASGTSPFTYQWMKGGASISGATSASYTTPVTAIADNSAQFTVMVSNSAGNVASNAATLTVNAATLSPTITGEPASRTVIAGQTASFSVSASGTSPFTYQWMKNGGSISGATSSTYTTPATAISDNGAQFTVTVSNSAGNATSNAAVLTVSAPTLLLSMNPNSLSFGNVNVGNSANLQATLTNTGTGSVTLSGMSVSGAGFGVSGVSSGQVLAPGQSAAIKVSFQPSGAGSVTGSVTVASNASSSASASLSGSGMQVVPHTVSLSWSPSTSVVAGYQVYNAQVSGGPYTKVTSSAVSSSNYSDTSAQSGKTYYYVVTSVDSKGVESSYSNQATAIIP